MSNAIDAPAIRRALVLGATGFIGRALVAELQRRSIDVVSVGGPSQASLPSSERAAISTDIRDAEAISALAESSSPSHVFNLAAVRSRSSDPSDIEESIDVNVMGTVSAVIASARAGADRVIVAGTAEEYGPIAAPYHEDDRERPVTIYGISKMLGSRAALAVGAMAGIEVAVLRIAVAYGPGQADDSLIGGLTRSLGSGSRYPMTMGEQTRDFVWIGDVVEGLIRVAVTPDASGRLLNFGSGESIAVSDAAATVATAAGKPDLIGLGEIERRPGEAIHYALDLTRTRETLGWLPATDFSSGVAQMMNSPDI